MRRYGAFGNLHEGQQDRGKAPLMEPVTNACSNVEERRFQRRVSFRPGVMGFSLREPFSEATQEHDHGG